MSKFRKKPVVIHAITFDELVAHGLASGANVVGGMPWSFTYEGHPISHETDDCYLIPTLEGTMRMERGDMLITGVKGEIYPCKPDIFAATYEAATDVLEKAIVSLGADKAPRVTPAAVEANIASEHYFNAEIGPVVARENAIQKIWPLMGYELKTKLANV